MLAAIRAGVPAVRRRGDLVAGSDAERDVTPHGWLYHAAVEMLEDPALLVAVTTDQRDRLVAAAGRVGRAFQVPMLLLRLGAPDLDRVLRRKSTGAPT